MSENPQSPRDVPKNPDQPSAELPPPPFEQPTIIPSPPPPFGAAPEQPGPPPPPGAPPPGQPVKKKSSAGKIIAWVVGGVVALGLVCVGVIVLVAVNTFGDRVQNAEVGDCLPASIQTAADVSKIDKVSCGSADAAAKIVGIVPNRPATDLQTDATLCSQFPTASSKFWVGEAGKSGKVFCLEPVAK